MSTESPASRRSRRRPSTPAIPPPQITTRKSFMLRPYASPPPLASGCAHTGACGKLRSITPARGARQRVAAKRGDDAHLLPAPVQRVGQRLRGGRAVRCLLKNGRARPGDDLRGYLLAAVRRQAVHEER